MSRPNSDQLRREGNRDAQRDGTSDLPDRNVVAVDGPAGSGKTTVAIRLANRLGVEFLDTGVLYRAATYLAANSGLTVVDEHELAKRIRNGSITLAPPSIADGRTSDAIVNGVDVTPHLRTQSIDQTVSAISALPEVRAALLPVQRAFAAKQRVIMVGRDIATTVFPEAAIKIYLDASLEERARRRWLELGEAGSTLTQAEVLADLGQRDAIDSNRVANPLRVDEGAMIVETDGKSIEAVVDEVAAIVRTVWGDR